MGYLLREGAGKGVALYTRCEDELLCKAELLLLLEKLPADGRPVYGFLDVDPTFTISEFKRAYRDNYSDYRRLMELRQQIAKEGWNYSKVDDK